MTLTTAAYFFRKTIKPFKNIKTSDRKFDTEAEVGGSSNVYQTRPTGSEYETH